MSSFWLIGWSSMFRRASKSSIIRVSMTSGSRRVTTTTGFFFCGMNLASGQGAMKGPENGAKQSCR